MDGAAPKNNPVLMKQRQTDTKAPILFLSESSHARGHRFEFCSLHHPPSQNYPILRENFYFASLFLRFLFWHLGLDHINDHRQKKSAPGWGQCARIPSYDYSVVPFSCSLHRLPRSPCFLLSGQGHHLLPLSFGDETFCLGNIPFHLLNQLGQLFLTLLAGSSVDIPGVNLPIRPPGRIASLPQ